MATFPSIDPSYGAQKKSQPNVRTVQFGDGYQARLTFGINQNPKEWQLEFRNLTEADAYKWICKSWTKTLPYSNLATIQTTFTQVFEP